LRRRGDPRDHRPQEDRTMQDFARWLGGLAAAGAAVLAVVWVLEARPRPVPPARDIAQAECRFRQAMEDSDALRHGRLRTEFYCGPSGRDHWDEARLMRGLVAGGAAVALLLLAAGLRRA
jgi:hypothetical protein